VVVGSGKLAHYRSCGWNAKTYDGQSNSRVASGAAAYIQCVMRQILTVLGVLLCWAGPATVSAQTQWQDTLPPRAYYRLAMQAKATDSVETRLAEWRAWAAAAPGTAAPRLALAMLSRFDQRFSDAYAWLDSAARVATTPMWRGAAARERVGAQLVRGEYLGIPALLRIALADSASIPSDEWAETRFVQLAHQRRIGGRMTLEGLDSISALASPTDSMLQSRLSCLRAVADPPRRLAHAESAISMANAARVPFISGNCELVVGMQFFSAGQMNVAMQWFVRSQKTARAAHDDATLGAALQYHGSALSSVGYVQSARAKLAEAIRIAQKIDDRNVEAWSLLSIANGAREIGDDVASSTAHRRAAILFAATGDILGAENVKMGEAMSLIALGDLDGASRIAHHARHFGDSINNPSLSVRALYMLGDVAARSNRAAEASVLLDSAEQIVNGRGVAWRTQITKYRGILALMKGDNAAAVRQLSEARAEYARGQSLYLYGVDGILSLAWLRSSDSTKAASTLIRANEELDEVRVRSASDRQRQVVAAPEDWGGSNSSVDHVVASFVQSPRWIATAFSVTERMRARALVKGSFGSEDSDTASMAAARARVRASRTVLAAVQRDLKPNTALLVYAGGTSPARTALMIITRNRARGITLAPLDSLDRDIVRWLALMESGEVGAGAGRQVAAAVLGNALRMLPSSIKRLVVIPQGPLYRVPFHALPVGAGVLGDRAIVTVAPSVSLAMAYAADPRIVPAQVLALGAGDTEVSSATPASLEINVERSERGNPLAPLQAAADEARAAAGWSVGSLSLTGASASESALKRESRGAYTVLHTAAHALTSDQILGANWLILRPDSTEDGYVSGGELAEISMGRSMVVLSGCRTTGDFGSQGDAIDGLVAPLLARGVRTVVASHWAVSDRWTKVLMERFYKNLAGGTTVAEAMNQAQTSLRLAGVPARFWAAFSVIGDGELRFSLAPR
jgi:tetratricopeptide (TPR) repeat protein